MSFRFVNLMCTLTFALACGSNVVDAGKLPDEIGNDGDNVAESVDAGSQGVPEPSTPDAGASGGSGCAIPDLGRYRLVFDSDGGKLERRIYSMRADGTELEPLTPPGELAREPQLSPDGKNLAYVTPEGIRLLSMTTGQSELLVPNGDHPTWSADGLRLFHQVCEPHSAGPCSWVLTLADRSTTYDTYGSADMDLSVDGSAAVYGVADRNAVPPLYGAQAFHTNDVFRIWDAVAMSTIPVLHPTISPDNIWLAAAMQCPNEQWPSLWVSPFAVSTGACEGHRVTPAGAASVSNPKWGPGNLIVYERATPPRDIAIVSADTGAECVIQGPGDDRNPSWAPLVDFAPPQ
jgi:Tol biopolymer transport system component